MVAFGEQSNNETVDIGALILGSKGLIDHPIL
jgi:hypothetical protein